jgi:hypothetical protein
MINRIVLCLLAITVGLLIIYGFPVIDQYFNQESGFVFSSLLTIGFICSIVAYKRKKDRDADEVDADK